MERIRKTKEKNREGRDEELLKRKERPERRMKN
jgi:hypothetical protein